MEEKRLWKFLEVLEKMFLFLYMHPRGVVMITWHPLNDKKIITHLLCKGITREGRKENIISFTTPEFSLFTATFFFKIFLTKS